MALTMSDLPHTLPDAPNSMKRSSIRAFASSRDRGRQLERAFALVRAAFDRAHHSCHGPLSRSVRLDRAIPLTPALQDAPPNGKHQAKGDPPMLTPPDG